MLPLLSITPLAGSRGSSMIHWLPQELQQSPSHPMSVHPQSPKPRLPRRETRVSTIAERMAPTAVAPAVVVHAGSCSGSKVLVAGSLAVRNRAITEAGTATCPRSDANSSCADGTFCQDVPAAIAPRPEVRSSMDSEG